MIGRESRSMYQDKKNSFFKLQQDAFGYMAWGETMELMAMGKKMLSIYDYIDKHTQPNAMSCNMRGNATKQCYISILCYKCIRYNHNSILERNDGNRCLD
jgi:hypothetical protein